MKMTETKDIRDDKAENLCRWGAARAGAIVALPGIGTMALMANEVYMIIRLGQLYDVKVSKSAAVGAAGLEAQAVRARVRRIKGRRRRRLIRRSPFCGGRYRINP